MGRDLRQVTPGFHGTRVRLGARCFGPNRFGRAGAATIDVVSSLGEYEVATIFMPYEQHAAIKAACTAFNFIMDRHEVGAPADAKPFSTYHEDRAKMLDLCRQVEVGDDLPAAIELADLVKAILEDEAVAIQSEAV